MPDKNAAAHRVLNNSKIFEQLGYHVVFCGVDHDIDCNATNVTKIGSFDNIPAAYPKSNREWAKQLIDFSHIEKTFNRYDDVKYAIAYNMHAIPLAKLLRFCKNRGVKVIADATEWYENKFSFHPVKLIKCIDTFIVMRYLQKKVDSMIAISSYLQRYYAKYVKNIVVIPPLVDLTEAIWNQPVPQKEKCIEFVYSGSPGTGKDKDKLGDIIEAFGTLGSNLEFIFTIVGITREQFCSIYPEAINALCSLGEKVHFKGRVSHAESIAALFKADCCIFIREKSRKNMAGFPTKFVEYYTCGANIIANDVSDIAHYFPKDGNSLLIHDFSVERLVVGIEKEIESFLYVDDSRRRLALDNPFRYELYLNPLKALFEPK